MADVVADPYVIRQRYSDAHDGLCRLVREHEIMRAALHTLLKGVEVVVECDAVGNLIETEPRHVEILPTRDGGILVRRARVTRFEKS